MKMCDDDKPSDNNRFVLQFGDDSDDSEDAHGPEERRENAGQKREDKPSGKVSPFMIPTSFKDRPRGSHLTRGDGPPPPPPTDPPRFAGWPYSKAAPEVVHPSTSTGAAHRVVRGRSVAQSQMEQTDARTGQSIRNNKNEGEKPETDVAFEAWKQQDEDDKEKSEEEQTEEESVTPSSSAGVIPHQPAPAHQKDIQAPKNDDSDDCPSS